MLADPVEETADPRRPRPPDLESRLDAGQKLVAVAEVLVRGGAVQARAVRGVPGRSTGLIWTRIVSFDLHSRTKGVIVGLPE